MQLIETTKRLLAFDLRREDMLLFSKNHFYFGLLGTWLVGIGRYWDDPKASILQHLGLGSVVYIFVLALFIWLILLPFKIEKWSYFTVVTFIGLTSFPALLYAIPVEQFMGIDTANTINAWFLAIVAAWRLGLLYSFLKHFTQLGVFNILTVTLMPICLIITGLTILNVHHVVFQLMGGIRNPSPHDTSYLVLILLTGISSILSIPLVVSYVIGIIKRRKYLSKSILKK